MPATLTKEEQVKLLEDSLKESHNILIGTYTGLSVAELAEFRSSLRDKGLQFKVVKNNLFRLAWKNTGAELDSSLDQLVVGQVGITFGGEDLPSAAKVYKDYKKKNDKFDICGGYFEGQVLDQSGVEGIAGLPTKEELLAVIARGLNTPTTNIALLMKEVISSLARGIKAVGEKNG